jgi:hypothetical protein
MTASKSPERHSFQKEGYVKRCEEKGEAHRSLVVQVDPLGEGQQC